MPASLQITSSTLFSNCHACLFICLFIYLLYFFVLFIYSLTHSCKFLFMYSLIYLFYLQCANISGYVASSDSGLVNNELERMWQEAFMPRFWLCVEVLSKSMKALRIHALWTKIWSRDLPNGELNCSPIHCGTHSMLYSLSMWCVCWVQCTQMYQGLNQSKSLLFVSTSFYIH